MAFLVMYHRPNILTNFPHLSEGCIYNLIETGLLVVKDKMIEISTENTQIPLDKVTKWPWPLEFKRG